MLNSAAPREEDPASGDQRSVEEGQESFHFSTEFRPFP